MDTFLRSSKNEIIVKRKPVKQTEADEDFDEEKAKETARNISKWEKTKILRNEVTKLADCSIGIEYLGNQIYILFNRWS
jgi:hypothetical protein